jgi:hypothetical protein
LGDISADRTYTITIDSSGTFAFINANHTISGTWTFGDNNQFNIGTDGDWAFLYDETSDDRLEIVNTICVTGDCDVYFNLEDPGADSTFTITNTDATYEANLSVEGDVTATTYSSSASTGNYVQATDAIGDQIAANTANLDGAMMVVTHASYRHDT